MYLLAYMPLDNKEENKEMIEKNIFYLKLPIHLLSLFKLLLLSLFPSP